MARRYIAIEIAPGAVNYAAAELAEREPRVVEASTLAVDSEEAVRTCLATLLEKFQPGFSDVVEVVLPAQSAYARILGYPFRNRRKLAAVAHPDFFHRLPVSGEGLMVDILPLSSPGEGSRVAAVAVEREKLLGLKELFNSVEFPLGRVGVLPWRLAGGVAGEPGNDQFLLAWVRSDEVGLALCQGAEVSHYVVRSGGAETEEVARWFDQQAQLLERRDGWSGLAMQVFGGDSELCQKLSGYGREILPVDSNGQDPGLARVAQFALSGLQGGRQHNFLRGELAPASGLEGLRVPLRRSLALSFMVLLLGVMTMWSGYYRHAREAQRLEVRAEQMLRSTFPEIGVIRDARLQMQGQLQQLRSRAGKRGQTQTAPLELLRQMSLNLPANSDVKLDEWVMTGSEVRLDGSTASFEEVERLAEVFGKLEGVRQAVVAESKAGRDNRVAFRMRLVIGEEI